MQCAFAHVRPVTASALVVAGVGAATILGAWFFQFGLGLKPCPLCAPNSVTRIISGIPLAALLILGDSMPAPSRRVLIAGLAVIAAGMLWNAGLGVYHAGIEWKLWAGPTECSGSLDSLGGSLLDELRTMRPVRCDEAAWRFLGIASWLQRADLDHAGRGRGLGGADGMAAPAGFARRRALTTSLRQAIKA